MELSEHQVRMLEVIAQVTPKILARKYRDVNCCIAATRIVIEALKKLHFKNMRPLAVEANIFNEVYVKKGRTPQSQEEAEAWRDEGAWQVVLGEQTEKHEGMWPGHLVVLINERYMLDIAVFQASRPQKQINLGPICTTVPEEFVKCEDKCGLMFNNCMVIYVSRNDKSYETAKDWWDVAKHKEAISEVVEEVKIVLGKKK